MSILLVIVKLILYIIFRNNNPAAKVRIIFESTKFFSRFLKNNFANGAFLEIFGSKICFLVWIGGRLRSAWIAFDVWIAARKAPSGLKYRTRHAPRSGAALIAVGASPRYYRYI
jgi:hypothetical protein